MKNLFGEEIDDNDVELEEFKKPPVPKLFDWLTSVNTSKKDLRVVSVNSDTDPDPECRGYEPFIINKGLGQSEATIGFANLMNKMPHIPKQYQYLFLLNGIPKNKSFAKWAKETKFDNLKEVMEALGYSKDKAKEAILVLGEEGVKQLIHQSGGIQKKVRRKRK